MSVFWLFVLFPWRKKTVEASRISFHIRSCNILQYRWRYHNTSVRLFWSSKLGLVCSREMIAFLLLCSRFHRFFKRFKILVNFWCTSGHRGGRKTSLPWEAIRYSEVLSFWKNEKGIFWRKHFLRTPVWTDALREKLTFLQGKKISKDVVLVWILEIFL